MDIIIFFKTINSIFLILLGLMMDCSPGNASYVCGSDC